MVPSKETTKPSKLPLIEWCLEVLLVLLFCCVVIRMCLFPWPPIYTLTKYTNPHGIREGNNEFSIQNRAEIKPSNTTTMIFSLLITNSNKAKDIIYAETKINVYKNGSSIGESMLPGFFQSGKSNTSQLVLVNVNQQKMKLGGRHKSGILKVSLETKVRYIILGWTTKQYLLKYEGFVPFNVSEMLFIISSENVILKPVMH